MALYGAYELCLLFLLLFGLFALTAGWGQLARRLLGLPAEDFWQSDSLWLGLILWITALGLAHLFIPINWLMRCSVVLIGLFGLFSIKNLRQQTLLLYKTLQRHPVMVICVMIGLTMLCLRSLQAPNNFDSALYHFQTIRWLTEYSIIPGLGNLHGRLAFNQSYFNFLAFLGIQPIASKGYAAAALFLLVLCAASLLKLYHSISAGRAWVILSLTFGVALTFGLLPSPTPDIAVALLQIQLFVCLVDLFNTDQNDFKGRLVRIVLSLLLACFIFTVKISALFFAFTAILVLLPVICRIPQAGRPVLIKTGVLCAGIVCIHLVRGYMLSGTPLFPSTIGAFWSLPWAMLPDNVRGEADWIYSWARMPGADPSTVLGNWSWLSLWWARLPYGFLYVFGSGLMMFVLNLILLVRLRQGSLVLATGALYGPIIVALIFWFFTAPDYRFLGSLPILLIALGGYLILQHMHKLLPINSKWWLRTAALSGLLVPACVIAIFLYFIGVRSLTLRVPEHLPLLDAPHEQLRSGQMFYQPKDGLCWDNVLPCTPFVYPDLKLLRPELGISAGFTLKN